MRWSTRIDGWEPPPDFHLGPHLPHLSWNLSRLEHFHLHRVADSSGSTRSLAWMSHFGRSPLINGQSVKRRSFSYSFDFWWKNRFVPTSLHTHWQYYYLQMTQSEGSGASLEGISSLSSLRNQSQRWHLLHIRRPSTLVCQSSPAWWGSSSWCILGWSCSVAVSFLFDGIICSRSIG